MFGKIELQLLRVMASPSTQDEQYIVSLHNYPNSWATELHAYGLLHRERWAEVDENSMRNESFSLCRPAVARVSAQSSFQGWRGSVQRGLDVVNVVEGLNTNSPASSIDLCGVGPDATLASRNNIGWRGTGRGAAPAVTAGGENFHGTEGLAAACTNKSFICRRGEGRATAFIASNISRRGVEGLGTGSKASYYDRRSTKEVKIGYLDGRRYRWGMEGSSSTCNNNMNSRREWHGVEAPTTAGPNFGTKRRSVTTASGSINVAHILGPIAGWLQPLSDGDHTFDLDGPRRTPRVQQGTCRPPNT